MTYDQWKTTEPDEYEFGVPYWVHHGDPEYDPEDGRLPTATQVGRFDKKLLRKFVAALRGGTWTQIYGRMRYADRYRCAVGVFAEVIGPGTATFSDVEALIPRPLLDALLTMNDTRQDSFSEISDYVESLIDSPDFISVANPPESNKGPSDIFFLAPTSDGSIGETIIF